MSVAALRGYVPDGDLEAIVSLSRCCRALGCFSGQSGGGPAGLPAFRHRPIVMTDRARARDRSRAPR